MPMVRIERCSFGRPHVGAAVGESRRLVVVEVLPTRS